MLVLNIFLLIAYKEEPIRFFRITERINLRILLPAEEQVLAMNHSKALLVLFCLVALCCFSLTEAFGMPYDRVGKRKQRTLLFV